MAVADRQNYNYYRNVMAVQIDPNFGATTTFYSGGIAGKCIRRNSKAWLRSNQDFNIHDGEGPITTMKWGGTMLAWANNQASEQATVVAVGVVGGARVVVVVGVVGGGAGGGVGGGPVGKVF